ncbi:MAG: hypothetical protein M0R51_15790 [Clostridia bacterium]|nr:hypothetical protein [Clostridia bacterium]
MQVLTIILSVGASVVSGTALFFLQRYFKRKDKKDERRDAVKAEENVLILKSINAVGRLTVANSIALRDGKTNGEMHTALEEYGEVDKEMYEYLLERNAHK